MSTNAVMNQNSCLIQTPTPEGVTTNLFTKNILKKPFKSKARFPNSVVERNFSSNQTPTPAPLRLSQVSKGCGAEKALLRV
jgi:hypothetical protein